MGDQNFADPGVCGSTPITLTIPVDYYNSSEALAAGEFVKGELCQPVTCDTFKATDEMSLVIPNVANESVPKTVPKVGENGGGFMQPRLKSHSKNSQEGKLFENVKCTSNAPFDWSKPLMLEMVRLYENKARGGLVDKWIGQLTANKHAGKTLQSEVDGTLRSLFSVTYEVDPRTGLIGNSAGYASENLAGDPDNGDGSNMIWYFVIPVALLAIGGLVAYFACDSGKNGKKRTPQSKKRGIKPQPAASSPAAQPLTAQPVMAAPTMRAPMVPTQAMVVPTATYQPVAYMQPQYATNVVPGYA